MAAAVVQRSTAIGNETLAEGVETEAEADMLLDLGYTTGQGFLFAAADSVDDLTARLLASSAAAAADEPLRADLGQLGCITGDDQKGRNTARVG